MVKHVTKSSNQFVPDVLNIPIAAAGPSDYQLV